MASRTAVELKEWIKEHRITEVECLVPDMAGIPRGKILPAGKFLATIDSGTSDPRLSRNQPWVVTSAPEANEVTAVVLKTQKSIAPCARVRSWGW